MLASCTIRHRKHHRIAILHQLPDAPKALCPSLQRTAAPQKALPLPQLPKWTRSDRSCCEPKFIALGSVYNSSSFALMLLQMQKSHQQRWQSSNSELGSARTTSVLLKRYAQVGWQTLRIAWQIALKRSLGSKE